MSVWWLELGVDDTICFLIQVAISCIWQARLGWVSAILVYNYMFRVQMIPKGGVLVFGTGVTE